MSKLTSMSSIDWVVRFVLPNEFAGNEVRLEQLSQVLIKKVPLLVSINGNDVRLEQEFQVA